MSVCPCCLRENDVSPPFDRLTEAHLNRTDSTFVANLASVYPNSLRAKQVMAGTAIDEHSFSVILSHLRRKIEPYGWTIPKSRPGNGHRGAYRLEPLRPLDQRQGNTP